MLSWLLVGHMAGDYLFQTRWMATQKTTRLSALAAHSAVYACAVWLASLPTGGLNYPSVLLVFATHAVIDKRRFTMWWCRHVTGSDRMWLVILTDQALHCVVLALACLLDRSL